MLGTNPASLRQAWPLEGMFSRASLTSLLVGMSRADGDIPGAGLQLPSAQPQCTEGLAAGRSHPQGTWVALTSPGRVWTALVTCFCAEGDRRVWFALQVLQKCKCGLKAGSEGGQISAAVSSFHTGY